MECVIRCQHSQTHHSTRYLNGNFCYVEQSYYKKINQQNALESYLAIRIHLAASGSVLASEATQSYQHEQESAYNNIFLASYNNIFLASVVKYIYLDHSELLHCVQTTCFHVHSSTSFYPDLLSLVSCH